MGSERQSEHCLAGGPDDVGYAAAPPPDDIPGATDVVHEGQVIRPDPRRRDSRQVNQCVDATVAFLDPEHRVQHLAVVGQIDRNLNSAPLSDGGPTRSNTTTSAMTDQLTDTGSAELARTARHDNTRHCVPPLN